MTIQVFVRNSLLAFLVGSGLGACRFAGPSPGENSMEYRLTNEAWSTYSEIYSPDRGYRVAFLPFGLVAHESGRMYETWQTQGDEFLEITHRSDRHYRYRWFEKGHFFAYCRPGFPRPFYIAHDKLSPDALFSQARSENLDVCSPTTRLRIAGGRVDVSNDDPSKIVTVDLSHIELDRHDRAAIRDARAIETLILAEANISDVDLAYLARLSSLTNLSLEGTSVSDDGLEYLVNLPLRSLDLSMTQVSDAGITRLREIESLEEVFLRSTTVTAQAIEGLKRSRPNLKVWT